MALFNFNKDKIKKTTAKNKDVQMYKDLIQSDMRKIDESQFVPQKDNRISIVDKTSEQLKQEEKEYKKELRKAKKNFKTKEELYIDGRDESVNYVVVRKEVQGVAPLHEVGLMDKIKVAFRYFNIKKGTYAKREAEAIRKQQLKNIKIESAIKKKINEQLEQLLDKKVKEVTLTVDVPADLKKHIDVVLSSQYFTMFDIQEIELNPNYLIYDESIPRMFKFRLRGEYNAQTNY